MGHKAVDAPRPQLYAAHHAVLNADVGHRVAELARQSDCEESRGE